MTLERQNLRLILLGLILALIITLIVWESNSRMEEVQQKMPQIEALGLNDEVPACIHPIHLI